jgi:hypothetical protein
VYPPSIIYREISEMGKTEERRGREKEGRRRGFKKLEGKRER